MRGHPPVGSTVAGYRLLSLVGEGATGVVYLAERDGTDDRVALKLLDPELATNERFRRRLLRESTIAAGLRHDHVVPILDFGETEEDGLYLAMRYVPGSDLRELLAREGPLEPGRAIGLLAQVGDALDEAHRRGLVHRDVKPANVLVEPTEDGEHAFLGDFGLVKHASSVSSLTGEHAFVGTIAYVSPEQIKGEALDGRADVYSLGCVLHECLTGSAPFDKESELAVVYAHLHERPPRASDLWAGLPEALDDVIAKATAKEPADRYETSAELIDAARAALAGELRPARRRRRALVAAGVATVALAVALVALLAGGSDEEGAEEPRLPVGGPGIALVDPVGNRVAGRVDLPEAPVDVVFGGGSAWALLGGTQRLVEVNVKRRKAVGGVPLPFVPGGIAIAGRWLYATEKGGPGIVRVDTATRKIAGRWTVDARGFRVSDPSGIAAGAGSVWVARGAEVVRVDGRSGRVLRRFPVPVTATLLAFGNGALWAASSENGLVEKIDPATNRIAARARLHGWISALAVSGSSVWAAATPDDVVFRLSADDASVETTLPAGAGPESLDAAGGALWIADSRGRALTRIDTRSGARSSVAVSGLPRLARRHRGLLWTAADPAPPALAADASEVRVAVRDDGLALDPADGPYPAVSQLFYATCAKLLNYPDAAGAAGQRLRPDAAAAMPALSNGGRTYTFRIRRGIRFSPPSGVPLDARAFKHTFERALSPGAGPQPAALSMFGDVVGAQAFHAGRARGVSGIVASGDRLSITLRRPAGDLPARVAMPIACAVPADTPPPDKAQTPIASAGPYYVSSEGPGQTVLERNPNYSGDRPQRPSRIVYVTGVPTAKAVALAGAGRVDVVTWDYDLHGPLAPGGPLARRHGPGGSGRYRLAPAPGVDMVAFNTHRPAFSDARVRRAASYALDRTRLAAVWSEPPTDRYVPPAIPGPDPGRVYPLSAPDLARARRLMRGRGPVSATLYFCGEPANARIAAIVRDNLRPLRIDVTPAPSLDCLQGPDPKAAAADLLLVTRSTPDLDPAPFLQATVGETEPFGPGGGPVTWDDAAFRKQLDRARRLPPETRPAEYARLERELLSGPAPYAAFSSFVAPEYRSARVGCPLVQGAYKVLDLAALCARSPG